MAFNISDFSGRINGMGLAKSNLFVMDVSVPPSIQDAARDIGLENLSFLCKSVSIPDITIGTSPYKQSGFGIPQQKANNFEFAPLTTVFMVDAKFGVLKFLNRWSQSVVNYDLSNGGTGVSSSGLQANHFAFKDEYVGTANVTMYSGNNTDNTYSYKFLNIYPTNIGGMTPSWENGAEILTVNVSFAYDYMTISDTTTSRATTGNLDTTRTRIEESIKDRLRDAFSLDW